jgi:hypothetical protein
MAITCLFLRLSRGRILPSIVDHTKKAALGGALVLHRLFQGKPLPFTLDRAPKKSLTLNLPFLEGIHHNLSSLPIQIETDYNFRNKEAETSTSQS